MQIQTTLQDRFAVLTVRGRMMSRPDVAPFKTRVCQLLDRGVSLVVVDLSGVKWFGAAMLGALVDGRYKTHAVGGDLWLAGVTRGVMRVLMVTQLNGLFCVLENADGAVVDFMAQTQDMTQHALGNTPYKQTAAQASAARSPTSLSLAG